MKKSIIAIATIVMAGLVLPYSSGAEAIPDWIKNNAMWWSEGAISETDFVSGLEYLIEKDVLTVPPTSVSQEKSSEIPDWIKNNAKWWAEGTITDEDFLNGVQYMIRIGIITLSDDKEAEPTSSGSEMGSLEAKMKGCQEIKKAYDRIKCEDAVELEITKLQYKKNSDAYVVGPITFYYPGAELEIMSSGQANLNIKLLAENTGSNENVILMCTGPAVCNYDVWDGKKTFKYSATDFTSGQIALKPGDAREIDFLFGPNIGYGGTTFEYDSAKDYYFRISEPWGSAEIPLDLE